MASYRALVSLTPKAIERFAQRIGAEQHVSIVGISHDRRQTPSDRDLLLEFGQQLESSAKKIDMKTLPDTASADAVKAVCGLLPPGRMHASIAALGQRTPVMPIDNQDKVRGLLDHFFIPEPAVFSRFSEATGEDRSIRLADSARREQELRQTIRGRWPYVRALSLLELQLCY